MNKFNPGCLSKASRDALEERERTTLRRVFRPPLKGSFDLIRSNIAAAAAASSSPRARGSRAAFEVWARNSTAATLETYASLVPVSEGRPSVWRGVWQGDCFAEKQRTSSHLLPSDLLDRKALGMPSRPALSRQKHVARVQSSSTAFARIQREEERHSKLAAQNLPVTPPTALTSPLVSPRMFTLPQPSPRGEPLALGSPRGASPSAMDGQDDDEPGAATPEEESHVMPLASTAQGAADNDGNEKERKLEGTVTGTTHGLDMLTPAKTTRTRAELESTLSPRRPHSASPRSSAPGMLSLRSPRAASARARTARSRIPTTTVTVPGTGAAVAGSSRIAHGMIPNTDVVKRIRPQSPHALYLGQRMIGGSFM